MDISALYKISHGMYVLGTKINGKNAGCIVDALVQSTNSPVPTIILCSVKENQTNEAIKQTGAFTVSILGKDVAPFIVGNFGFQSGRTADKWANVEHAFAEDLPVLKNAIAHMRCKVTEIKELTTHTAFFCEVIDAWQGEENQSDILTYGEYQQNMKEKTRQAFIDFQNDGKTSEQLPKWTCLICGYVYDGEIPFEELPESWCCPVCGAPKNTFKKQ